MIFGFKLWVLVLVVGVMLVLRWRRAPMLAWALAWWGGLFFGLKVGFAVPLPGSVITIYMAIATASILAYVSADRGRWAATVGPIERLILEPRLKWALAGVVVLLPALVAASVYNRMSQPLEAPGFGRSVHPSPPTQIDVHERTVSLVTSESPLEHLKSAEPEEYQKRVQNGRRVYYQNCFYCHGDGLGGDGMFAYGLNPIPSNFIDPGVLPNFQESFFFWRVAKGGPGLPEEGGPWDTAMPAWESFLTEDEIWDVVGFLFEFTGYQPRALAEHGAGGEATK